MQTRLTRESIMLQILQKKRELEELERLNKELITEAQVRAASGGRRKDHNKFKAKIQRNSFGSSPSISPKKDTLEKIDYRNTYVINRPKSRCMGESEAYNDLT